MGFSLKRSYSCVVTDISETGGGCHFRCTQICFPGEIANMKFRQADTALVYIEGVWAMMTRNIVLSKLNPFILKNNFLEKSRDA